MDHVSGLHSKLSVKGCRTVSEEAASTVCSELMQLMFSYSLCVSLSGQVDAVHWSVHGQCDLQFFSLHNESGIPLQFVHWVRQVKAQLTEKTRCTNIFIATEYYM